MVINGGVQNSATEGDYDASSQSCFFRRMRRGYASGDDFIRQRRRLLQRVRVRRQPVGSWQHLQSLDAHHSAVATVLYGPFLQWAADRGIPGQLAPLAADKLRLGRRDDRPGKLWRRRLPDDGGDHGIAGNGTASTGVAERNHTVRFELVVRGVGRAG